MSARKKRKKRVRLTRLSERHHAVTSDEERFRLAARLSLALAIVMLVVGVGLPYLMPSWNRALGAHGNVALRDAGMALVIVSAMFVRIAKAK